MFVPVTQDTLALFVMQVSNYLHENNQIYFQELYNYIKVFNNNLDKLKGLSNNLLDEELTNKFNKYIFVFIIDKISEYIKELIDEESDIHNTMNDKLNEINPILNEFQIYSILSMVRGSQPSTHDGG